MAYKTTNQTNRWTEKLIHFLLQRICTPCLPLLFTVYTSSQLPRRYWAPSTQGTQFGFFSVRALHTRASQFLAQTWSIFLWKMIFSDIMVVLKVRQSIECTRQSPWLWWQEIDHAWHGFLVLSKKQVNRFITLGLNSGVTRRRWITIRLHFTVDLTQPWDVCFKNHLGTQVKLTTPYKLLTKSGKVCDISLKI